ncbi:hypothetical protein [Proteiniborus sp. MB09-C3]|uniref:hypothetical protein n=1 Tax=Proteiniborus sp. MB09-C3 TaxID=3050072 RepID=UPI002556F664|nr:hypothetical protein [Proteiniborus sp. MB09-C3]WIV13797.1 hypothetical protein QO263_08900 [Proteiniborus sp. MB09-C3]
MNNREEIIIKRAYQSMKLPEMDFTDSVMNKIRNKTSNKPQSYMRIATVVATICLVVIITFKGTAITTFAKNLIASWSSSITVENGTVGIGDSIDIIKIKSIEGLDYKGRKKYNSFADIEKELEVELLESSLSQNTGSELICLEAYRLDTINAVRIFAPYYILGDIEDIEYYGDDFLPGASYKPGREYYSPVKATLFFVTSEENTIKEERRARGIEFKETYLSKENDIEAYFFINNEYYDDLNGTRNALITALFVHKNVKYELEGMVSIDTMKKIIDSFN